LCHEPACWEQALRRHALERALRVESLQADDLAMLEQMERKLAIVKEAGDPGEV
jgi:hypothetical protein